MGGLDAFVTGWALPDLLRGPTGPAEALDCGGMEMGQVSQEVCV